MKYLGSTLLLATLAIFATQVVAGPGFTCLRAAGDPKQFWNLDKVNKGNSFNVSVPSTEKGVLGEITLTACHALANLPEGCDKTTVHNPIGVVTGTDKTGAKFCSPLSQSGMDDSKTNTLWEFTPAKPTLKTFANFVAVKTNKVFTMFRGAPESNYARELAQFKESLGTPDIFDGSGLIMKGTNVGRNSLPYNFVMTLTCDNEMAKGEIKNRTATYDTETAVYNIGWTSSSNCGFALFSFWNKLGWGQYIVEGVLALGCLVMCFFGLKFHKPSLAVIGFLTGGLATYIFLNLFSTVDSENDWYMWVVIGVSVLLGIVFAVILVVMEKVSLFASGAFLGYVGGAELYNLVLFRLDGTGTPVWLYVSIVVLMIAGGFLAIWLHEYSFFFLKKLAPLSFWRSPLVEHTLV
jgi:hypothetical protein